MKTFETQTKPYKMVNNNNTSPDTISFSSAGKLLLTGEYAVLLGASALVVPINLRQSLNLLENKSEIISWISMYNNKVFFKSELKTLDLDPFKPSFSSRERFIISLLKAARSLNPTFLNGNGYSIITNLEANPEWGFGSSAQLTVNIARLSKIAPWHLHKAVSKGSGADVICAEMEHSILFSTEGTTYSANPVDFNPPFLKDLILIYTGHKQDTATGVENFLSKTSINNPIIGKIDSLTREATKAMDKKEFIEIIEMHERTLSELLNIDITSNIWFNGFPGLLKSLGTWGGDYIMAIPYGDPEEAIRWLKRKTNHPIFRLSDLILNNTSSK